MPKSFAKETRIIFSSGSNSNSQQNSHLHHHSIVHIARQSVVTMDPTAMAVPFSGGSSGTGGVSTSVSTLGSSVVQKSDPFCNAISQTSFSDSSTSVSICNNHSDSHPVFSFTKSLTKSKNVDIRHSDTRFHNSRPG